MAGWKKVIVSGSSAELSALALSGVSNAGADTDKFLVLDSSGNVDFRTGTEVLSDIGAGAGSGDISSVVAGSGLTGGATTGDATLNVIGGTGITANANDIELTNGLIADGSNITSVGTIDTGVWQGTTIKTAYIGDDQVTEDKLANTLLAEIDANTAKVTNVSTNLTITGTDEARVIVSSDGTNATIPVATTSVSGLMNTTLFDKLNAIEASADVTDATNVTAAGALMDSEMTDLAGVKGVTISTLQVKPSEGAFANGDKTKLDAIEASADVTDTANVKTALNASLGGAATIGDASDTITIPGILTITGTTTELQVTNLNVEDQFILLNSGSTSGDSGIIFGGTGNGTAQAGHSIFCDDSDGDGATFGYKSQLAHNVTTGGAPTSKLGNIESSTSAPASAPTFQGVGTIHVKTDSEEIYIYA